LLARENGQPRIIAETALASTESLSATLAAISASNASSYMGTEDMARQALNVARMRMSARQVVGVDSGSRTLKDAINEAMTRLVTNVRTTHYLLGSVLGAHPYPTMVAIFQSVIGREAREANLPPKKTPAHASFRLRCGGSNSIGLFYNSSAMPT